MKKVLLLLLLLPLWALARVEVDLQFEKKEVKQGEIVLATVRTSPESMNQLNLQKLKGNSFAKTLFLYDFSPWLHSNGDFSATAKIIFTEVPKETILKDTINGQEVELKLSPVNVIPTQAEQQLLFGTYEIPTPAEIMKWVILAIAVSLVGILGWKLKRKFTTQREIRLRKQKLIEEITSARDYEGVVDVWKKKYQYLTTFPQLETPFKNLEQVLFKYQFKPSQQASEKEEVFQAYQKFLAESQEGFRGI